MAKESTHRAEELKDHGWSVDEISRYVDLWEYRQRWGAINLEREDRQFLRKAESTLPKIITAKVSVKKPIKEKTYYRWISLFLDAMNKAEDTFNLKKGERGVWPILLEEEIRTLEYYQPVLGLPDTLKAKKLDRFREDMATKGSELAKENGKSLQFDFQEPLINPEPNEKVKFRPLRSQNSSNINNYPVLKGPDLATFRLEVRSKMVVLIKETLPSLAETDKPEPPEEWTHV